MQPVTKYSPTLIWIAATAAIALVCAYMYLNRWQPPAEMMAVSIPAGEPGVYAATVIRTVDAGTNSEQFVTRIIRSGEMTREEWTEQGAARALVLRPDLGKSFLLALDKQEYVETSFHAAAGPAIQPASESASAGDATDPESIDRAFTDAPAPLTVQTLALADQVIDNHTCQVVEQRRTFADGHTEITLTFHARDLNGLAIREEAASTASDVKVVTERRDIHTEVSPDEFKVPAGFKRVDKLSK